MSLLRHGKSLRCWQQMSLEVMAKVICPSPLAFNKGIDAAFKWSCEDLFLKLGELSSLTPFLFSLFWVCIRHSWLKRKVRYFCDLSKCSFLMWFCLCFFFFFFFSTPATLDQNYIVCELQQKVNMLYSFLRTHLKKKSIVFFASCKEVCVFSSLLLPQNF